MPDGAALIRPTLARIFTPPSGKNTPDRRPDKAFTPSSGKNTPDRRLDKAFTPPSGKKCTSP